MDRTALLTAQSALLAVRQTVVLNHGSTDSFDRALASIRQELATSANGTASAPTIHTEYVDTTEAAEILGCSPRWARDIAKRIGVRKGSVWLIRRDALPQEDQ